MFLIGIDNIPNIGSLQLSESASSALVGLISGLALSIALAILPYLMHALLSQASYGTFSQTDRVTVRVYWLFLMLNVFLFSLFAGSIFDSYEKLGALNAFQFADLVGSKIPEQSIYFISYMLVQMLVLYPLFWLLRIDEFALAVIKRIRARCSIERKRAFDPMPYKFWLMYSRELMIFAIILTYS